jgi:hypothetical protein
MYIIYAALMFCKNSFSYKIDDNFELNFTYKLVVILYQ